MKCLPKAFLDNSYSKKETSRTLHPSHKELIDKRINAKSALLPYIHKITDRIGRTDV